jgi:uncharacterized protein (TIGR00369 family)
VTLWTRSTWQKRKEVETDERARRKNTGTEPRWRGRSARRSVRAGGRAGARKLRQTRAYGPARCPDHGGGEGTCEIEVAFRDELTQQQRYFHGTVAGAIADNAGGYAALTLAPPDREVLTVEYKVNFVAPAWGEKLVARGKVLSAGRRLSVCRAEVFAVSAEGEETPCAVLQQTTATTSA